MIIVVYVKEMDNLAAIALHPRNVTLPNVKLKQALAL